MRLHVRWHSRAGIADSNGHVTAGWKLPLVDVIQIDFAHADAEPPAAWHRIACIQRKIDQRRIQFIGVGVQVRNLRRAVDLHHNRFAQCTPEHRTQLFHERLRHDRPRLQRLPARESEQPAGEIRTPLHGA